MSPTIIALLFALGATNVAFGAAYPQAQYVRFSNYASAGVITLPNPPADTDKNLNQPLTLQPYSQALDAQQKWSWGLDPDHTDELFVINSYGNNMAWAMNSNGKLSVQPNNGNGTAQWKLFRGTFGPLMDGLGQDCLEYDTANGIILTACQADAANQRSYCVDLIMKRADQEIEWHSDPNYVASSLAGSATPSVPAAPSFTAGQGPH
ncbi:hypothetical protein BCR39DRAFT_506957 [Naematelia encephala]|uniref:Ricin B lectin domain-containing protein n=1 Tax=Naematelia encephala TaxID=71784 RepID=A0A1Y2AT52_9TREE|nr:hypothetical protein BCR39DRAFT_506957 [Naematelia encephala]